MGEPSTSSFWDGALARTRIEHLWALLPPGLLAIVAFSNPLRLLDFWWHLKLGQVIVETRSLPQVDLFSFTAAGQPFIPGNWLAEVIYYLLYLLGGFPLLRVMNTALLVLALVIMFHLAWIWTGRIRLSAGCLFLLLVPLAVYSSVRPQAFSFPLFAAFLWILFRPAASRSRARYLLPLLMALWVNLHGAFLLGLGLIGIRIAGDLWSILLRLKRGSPEKTPPWIPWLPVLLLTGVATLLNPQGTGIYGYVLSVLSDPASQGFVSEWQPPEIFSWSGALCFFGPFYLSLLVLIKSRKVSPHEALLLLGFSVLGLSALRNGIWFALVAVPVVARHLHLLWPERQPVGTLKDRRGEIFWLNQVIGICLLLVVIALSPWVYPRLSDSPQWDRSTPVEVMDFFQERQLEGNIFHPQLYGDYLIWRLWPQQRSFVDGRVHLFGSLFNRNYLEIFCDTCWFSRIEPLNIQFLLMPRGEQRSRDLIADAIESPDWRVIYRDQASILFQKKLL